MEENKSYATIGMVYDFLVDMHQKTGRSYSFPEAIATLGREGHLFRTMPDFPPFHYGMDLEEYVSFIRKLPIYADPIIPQVHTYMFEPSVEEVVLFPDGKDVFCILNMPHMVMLPHTHNFFEITYVLKGSCTLLFEGESATLSAGDLCIISPGSRHSLPLEPGCIAPSVMVRRSTFDSVFGNLLTQKDLLSLFFRNNLYGTKRANYLLLKTGNDPFSFHSMQQLHYESNLPDSYANDCAVSLLNLLLARALRAASATVTLHHYDGYSEKDFDFALVLQHIQQNYRTVTLSSLAKTFHFSEAYLSKLIRKNLNQSFTEILRTLKMNHAVEYLMNTSMKISEIAEKVGYDSVDHFTRTFRKVYGASPLEYKKTH
ncbi:MAG: helix-turn-helix domain-containing protein [Oscillospiraceae bacterium]|nr:helix-turn-helix domain-containing protein [Oscillospiraceae bacterium]